MARYLLDTNILSEVIKNPQGNVAEHMLSFANDDLCTSVIVASEMRYGAIKKGHHVLIERVDLLLQSILVLPLDIGVDRHYGHIRAQLEKQGNLIGANDLLIAAHALSLDATLVTDNINEFCRISTLRIENWLRNFKSV